MTLFLVLLGGLLAAAVLWAAAAERRAAYLQAQLDAERRAAADKLATLEQARASLRDSFAALSADALRHNNESFLQLARASLEQAQERSKTDLDLQTEGNRRPRPAA